MTKVSDFENGMEPCLGGRRRIGWFSPATTLYSSSSIASYPSDNDYGSFIALILFKKELDSLPQNSNENQASESFYKTNLDFPWNTTKSLDDD